MKPHDIRIVFAGTPHFADRALQGLLSQGFNVVGVLTQPDRPSGRGLKLTASPVKLTALAHRIPVFQPQGLRLDGKYPQDAASTQERLKALDADVMVVAAYGLILPQWVFNLYEAPKAGCINIHASLLPRWRGAAPIQRAIAAGDTRSGVCLMKMDLGLDTGALYTSQEAQIDSHTTGGQLLEALTQLGAAMVCRDLPAIVAGTLQAKAQSEQGISYAHKLLREHGQLNWQHTALELANQIRAFDPNPGCFFEHAGQPYKVWAAHPLQPAAMQTTKPAGALLAVSAQGVDVACGPSGLEVLRITEIQKPNSKRMPVAACWQHLGLNA